MDSPSPLITIRNARMSDWPHLRRVVRAIFPHLQEAEISYVLRHHHNGTVVACDGPNIVGYFQINPHHTPGVAWLNFIGVLPAWRSHGTANALLTWCERHGKACGFDAILLDAFEDNLRAHRFYERNGYVRLAKQAHADGVKFRFTKSLAQTPALTHPLPSLEPASAWTRVLRKLVYAVLMWLPSSGYQPHWHAASDAESAS